MNTSANDNAAIAHQVVAHNDAQDSGNPMHDDAAAKAMNFKGALVPGITVYGYMSHALVSQFGPQWLASGWLHVRFRQPVYAGENIDIVAAPLPARDGPPRVTVEAVNPDGERCAVGRGGMANSASELAHQPATALPSARQLVEKQWPATEQGFNDAKILGCLRARFNSEEASDFLAAMQDDHPIYRQGIVHPAWLLRQANLIVDRNFAIGPWIHTESEVRNLDYARCDQDLTVRASVLALFQRNGHEYVDLDVAVVADDNNEHALMRVMHRAIYKMAG